ncbi:HNH endonuclease [Patescibacteria group bacterium]|nr:HNH endonuclease [Patescibacteria group bacterium]MBU1703577.1 HNH endonuclease [Patescibacteria group bacterium]MBU1954346.1 HNH endonuclease [Patescibacteria group bacterium]
MTNLFVTAAPANAAHQTLTDAQLYGLCKQYGQQALEARRKFIGLLPEVYRRRLYAKKGFSSINEFAAKLCGVSEEQVRLALRLEQKFEDKPVLKMALTSGAISVNKLARVASIATSENQEYIAEMAKVLPKSALETLVRDVKEDTRTSLRCMRAVPGHGNPQQSSMGVKSVEWEAEKSVNALRLDEDVREELSELQGKGIDISSLIREMLDRRREELAQEKQKLAEKENRRAEMREMATSREWRSKPSRYISAKIRRQLRKEHGNKCTIATCQKPATIIHHTQRFALSQNHDPNFLAPLCREHHAIAHTIDQKYRQEWQL